MEINFYIYIQQFELGCGTYNIYIYTMNMCQVLQSIIIIYFKKIDPLNKYKSGIKVVIYIV